MTINVLLDDEKYISLHDIINVKFQSLTVRYFMFAQCCCKLFRGESVLQA